MYQSSIEFYRVAMKIRALQPVPWPKETEFAGHDFYVLSAADAARAPGNTIRILFSDRRAEVVLGTSWR